MNGLLTSVQVERLYRNMLTDTHIDSSSNQNKSYVVSYDCDVTPGVLLPNVKIKIIKTKPNETGYFRIFGKI